MLLKHQQLCLSLLSFQNQNLIAMIQKILLLLFLLSISFLKSQIITTVAGTGAGGYTGDGGLAINAQLNTPNQLAFDAAGNLFIAEDYNHTVRKINTSGIISTVVGTGTLGFSGDGGLATSAQLNRVNAIAVDAAGNLYVSDADNYRIRKVNTSGVITTIAGIGTDGHSGDGGLATAAEIGFTSGIQVDAVGNIYLAEQGNGFCVRKINTSGIITTIAGTGTNGFSGDNGQATAAQLNAVSSICFDATGNLYISVFGGSRIRKVSTAGIITTIAGTGAFASGGDGGLATSAQIYYPYGIVTDAANNIYFCESGNHKIRRIDAATGIITTVAGVGGGLFAGGYAGDGGPAVSATLSNPSAIAIDASGNIFIGDYGNNVIRKITIGTTGLEDFSKNNYSSLLYPNPNNGSFNLKVKNAGEFIITNALGERIKTISVKDVNETIFIDGLSQGIYFVTGKNTNQKVIVF